jgi:hypothetical protein
MKYKITELTGALLDAAVAKAVGLNYEIHAEKVWGDGYGITIVNQAPACWTGAGYYEPSTDWRAGGAILDRAPWCLPRQNTNPGATHRGQYAASTAAGFDFYGETPLIAAMRAYVAHKLGEEVEL